MGSVLHKNRKKSVMTVEKLDEIGASLERNSRKSLTRLAAQSGMSLGSAHTAMRLQRQPCKMAAVQRLTNPDTGISANPSPVPEDVSNKVYYLQVTNISFIDPSS
jgi:hypothetical protein